MSQTQHLISDEELDNMMQNLDKMAELSQQIHEASIRIMRKMQDAHANTGIENCHDRDHVITGVIAFHSKALSKSTKTICEVYSGLLLAKTTVLEPEGNNENHETI
jgi:hypothetical protein